jgi:hypothetical protein
MTFFRLFRCGNNDAIDERSRHPRCFGSPSHVIQYDPHSANAEDQDDKAVSLYKPSEQKSEFDKLIDMIEASETANETETEEEEDEWDMSDLVGESLLTNYSPATVNTRDAFYGKTLVLLYFGSGDAKTLEMLELFDAGYDHTVLAIVYCNDDLSAFVDMPARWLAAQNVAELSASLDVSEGPCLMVIDPLSGDVLSENALDDILNLDASNAVRYDEQATKLFNSWTHHMPIEQIVIGEMTVELPDRRGLVEVSRDLTHASSTAIV